MEQIAPKINPFNCLETVIQFSNWIVAGNTDGQVVFGRFLPGRF